MPQSAWREKRFVIAIPIPYLDRRGNVLDALEVESWKRKALRLLTDCLGGATVILAPGMNVVPDRETGKPKVLYEEKQTLAVSACADRGEFLAKRGRIQAFVVRMGRSLDQDSVFVLAFASESFLIEIEYSEKAQSRIHRDRSRRRSEEKRTHGNGGD